MSEGLKKPASAGFLLLAEKACGQANAYQIRLPKQPFVGAPPRGEAVQLRMALVRGGAPLLRIRASTLN
ncbi:MAG: hypothetical protein B7X51_02610 [Pseudomonas sp. 34-62-33]|nr:MAG: hypothetical protein B7X51_02610 [Pseudomonas sp. 34-62-33]